MLSCDGLGEERALAADALVDGLGEVLEEQLLLVRLHVRALDTPDPGDKVIDSQVLDDSGENHPGAPRPTGAVNEAVAALGEVVGEVQDVVDEIPRGWDLKVGDGPVVDDEPALLAVELEEALHAAVLGKLLLLRQGADHPL